MAKYDELDVLILQQINCETPVSFHTIHFSEVYHCCENLAAPGGEGFRVLDRRLQALRKAGKIKSIPGKGWLKTTG